MTRSAQAGDLEARIFDLEQLVLGWDQLADQLDPSSGLSRPAWLWTLRAHVEALRAAHEAGALPSQ